MFPTNKDPNLSYNIVPSEYNNSAIVVTLYWRNNYAVEGATIVADHDFQALKEMNPEDACQLIMHSLAKSYNGSMNGDGIALFTLVKDYL
jgi:hypothetical protein